MMVKSKSRRVSRRKRVIRSRKSRRKPRRNLSIIAFASHDIQMGSPKKTALSSTDQARKELQSKHDSLGFLDKVHPSKVSLDLNESSHKTHHSQRC